MCTNCEPYFAALTYVSKYRSNSVEYNYSHVTDPEISYSRHTAIARIEMEGQGNRPGLPASFD